MPFVPGYQHDIFVSYAHVDDDTFTEAELPWVTTLVTALEKRLAQKLGRADAFDLWMDNEDLSRHQGLTDQILNAVKGTATLVIVLSPGYVASRWCQREVFTFLKQVKQRLGAGGVFVIEREEIDANDRPAEFGDLLGFRFWQSKTKQAPARILGWPKPNGDDDYYLRVEELSSALAAELKRLRQSGADAADAGAAPSNGQAEGPCVFLAQVTDDLDPRREEVRRYLQQVGIRTLPDKLYTLEPDPFRDAMQRDLAECQLFVQLLSELPGKRWPNLPQGFIRYQHEIARDAGVPILQWRNSDLDVDAVEDGEHREFLRLETVRAEGVEEFKAAVKKRAMEKPEEGTAPGEPLNAFVFVNSEDADRDLAGKIADALASSKVDVSLTMEGGTPAERRSDLERNLVECDGMIIVYGSSTAGWVREQLLQARKAFYQRTRPLSALAVYQGPPEEKPPLNLRMHNLRILDCRRGFDQGELSQFVGSLTA